MKVGNMCFVWGALVCAPFSPHKVSASGTTTQEAASGTAPPLAAPRISDLDRIFLSDLVRRVVESIAASAPCETRYVPPSLKPITCRVGITLRRGGYFRSAGVSSERPVAEATIQAAGMAARALSETERTGDQIGRMRIEIELLSPFQQLRGNLNDIPLLQQELTEGLDGVALHYERTEFLIRPSEWRARNLTFSRCVRDLINRTGLDRTQLAQRAGNMSLHRMRSTHWVESDRRQPSPVLDWGVRWVRPDEVTPETVNAAIQAAGQYLLYRQNPQGVFAYSYLPSEDRYAEADSWVHQAGAMWIMSRYARSRGPAEALKAADNCIRAFVPLLRPIPQRPEAVYVMLPGEGAQKLGVTALYLLAIMDHPNPEPLYPAAAKVIEAILGQQQKDGRILADFPAGALKSSQDTYPAEALLALTRVLRVQASPSVKKALAAALPFYYDYFRDKPSTLFAAWQSMAYGAMAQASRERKYADFVFEMTDTLAALQLSAENCPWPQFHGGIAIGPPASASFRTGLYIMGFAEALKTARVFQDQARAARYEDLIRKATRFVLQLQFKAEECYYVRSERDVLGGIRTSLTDNELRLDCTAWGLGGLLSAKETLFADGKKE